MVRGDVTSDLAVLANLAEITNKSAADHHCRWLTHSIKFQRTCQARPKQPIRPNNNVNFSTRNESQFFDLTSCINNFRTTLRRYYIKPDILWTSDGSILTVFKKTEKVTNFEDLFLSKRQLIDCCNMATVAFILLKKQYFGNPFV